MPFFMDRHDVSGATDKELAEAHLADIAMQEKFGVTALTYWHDYDTCHLNCLVEAPSAEAANAVHEASHGNLATEVIEVDKTVVEAFLGRIDQTPAAIDPATTSTGTSMRIILFTDIVGSTAMTQKLGDAAAMDILEIHDNAVRGALQKFSGREVKHTGDGIMASFASVSGSVQSAIDIQRALVENSMTKPELPLRVKIGLCAGEPVEKNEDLFGASVQLAARICDHASAEEIKVTHTVQDLCLGKGFQFENPQEVMFKGFDDPIKITDVRWQ